MRIESDFEEFLSKLTQEEIDTYNRRTEKFNKYLESTGLIHKLRQLFEQGKDYVGDEDKEFENLDAHSSMPQFDMFEDDLEDDEEDGMFVLVQLHSDERGIGFSVDKDEVYGKEFFEMLSNIDRAVAENTLDNLIKLCEKRQRNVLAREIREFLSDSKSTLH